MKRVKKSDGKIAVSYVFGGYTNILYNRQQQYPETVNLKICGRGVKRSEFSYMQLLEITANWTLIT